jgi:thiol-disulfide isomerase/thioredoxin
MSKSTNRRGPSARPTTTKSNRPISSKTAAQGRRRMEATRQAGRGPGAVSATKRFRSRHPVLSALAPVIGVVAILATFVIVKATSSSSAAPAGASRLATGSGATASSDPGTTALAPSVVASLSVPVATLDTVGKSASVAAPTSTGTNVPILRDAAGKPIVTYIGAEYCPYCAAERWGIAVALSRFGTFTNLSATHSSSSDVYPNTQTLSFYGSSYSSPYVDFQPVEEQTNQAVNGSYPTLQQPTAAQSNLLARFDAQGSIPFLDIGNKYVVVGASYSPQVLAGLTQSQIAQQLSNPNSAVAQAIDGTANEITAAIVQVTGQQPTSVASSSVIASIAKSLGA